MLWIAVGSWLACAGGTPGGTTGSSPVDAPRGGTDSSATDSATVTPPDVVRADVQAVRVTGTPGAYTFSVTLRSDDTGCSQYADWWEVFTPNGTLVYRRILAHSHVDDQPFERSGGPVDVEADQEVLIRGHMSPNGYVGEVWRGTVSDGFSATSVEDGFAHELATEAPLPDGCLF